MKIIHINSSEILTLTQFLDMEVMGFGKQDHSLHFMISILMNGMLSRLRISEKRTFEFIKQ